jgi:hypothetical protein
MWSISRYYTHEKNPAYNTDVASFLLPRNAFAKVKSVRHKVMEAIFDDLLT